MRTFDFTIENFSERLKEAILPYAERIGSGSFYLRIERRGHAGEINSHEQEVRLGEVLYETLVARGKSPASEGAWWSRLYVEAPSRKKVGEG